MFIIVMGKKRTPVPIPLMLLCKVRVSGVPLPFTRRFSKTSNYKAMAKDKKPKQTNGEAASLPEDKATVLKVIYSYLANEGGAKNAAERLLQETGLVGILRLLASYRGQSLT